MFRQLKRNAQRVPTRLAGGKHGYLCLLLPTAKYNAIPNTSPFVRPVDPGVFTPAFVTIPGTATRATRGTTATGPTTRPPNSAELAQQKATYEENLRLFLEVETIKTLLRNQIINAFDDDYIQALRDANDVVSMDIPAIMQYLIKAYGQIRPEDFCTIKNEVEEFVYDPILPIDVLFNKLEFFSDLSDFIKKPLQDAEKVDIIYIILNRCGVFQDSLKTWNKRPAVTQTYDEMKTFFRDEHLELDKVNALTKKESTLNHTEFLVQHTELLGEMESCLKLNLAEAITTFANAYEKQEAPTVDDKDDTSTEITSALSTITGNSNKQTEQMMKLFQGLCKKVDALAEMHKNNGNESNNPVLNPRTGKPWRRYCWSHGCCDHWSSKCPQHKPGHKLNATFKNRMGGCTDGVLGA